MLWFSCNLYAATNEIEIFYFGNKDDVAFLGIGQGLEDSGALDASLRFRLKIESENFRPYNDPRPAVIFAAAGSESVRLLSVFNPDIPIFSLIDDTASLRELDKPTKLLQRHK